MSDSPCYPATREQIVAVFLDLLREGSKEWLAHNWQTCPTRECSHKWDANPETYINGVIVTVDYDYHMGYLIECVDRSTGYLSYHAVVTFHGWHRDTGHWDHESMIYEPACGTFFERTEAADYQTLLPWAVTAIDNMIRSHEERAAGT